MLRHIAIGACLVLAVLPSGCGAKSRPLDRLQYWNGFTGPDGNITQPIIEAFEESSSLQVEVQKMPWGTYFDKLIAAIAAGDPPDVFVLHFSELASYAEMGALLPLDACLEGELPLVPREDRINSVWDRCYYKGIPYGVPLDVHLLGLYYNKELFDKAGLAYPSATVPLSGEEMLRLAKKLTLDEDGDGIPETWGFTFSGAPFRNFTSLLWQFDGDLLNAELDEPAIASKEGHAALQWMADCVMKHQVSPRPEGLDTWQYFLQGRVAMFVEGCWVLNGLKKNARFPWDVAPLFQAGPRKAVWATGHVVCMSRTLPEERRKNALRLIGHLSDTGVAWSASGMIPARYSQVEDPAFLQNDLLKPFVAQLGWLRFEPNSPAGIELRDRYEQSVITALVGLSTVDDALNDADGRMRRVLAWWEK